ncbi:MAG TPA: DNA methyltransferase [Stellaceae bacterium]|nr:DNA methyltransferase [Stellaceae bacterium]
MPSRPRRGILTAMSPEEFITRWRGNELTERAAAQSHFRDLCDLLGVPAPTPASKGEYEFEKPTRRIGDRQGFADVWWRGRFAWEYKRDRRNLVEAYAQLKGYADALENPPLLIVSDTQEIRIHTNFTNAIAQQHVIALADLRSVEARDLLRNCFRHPERLLPTETREGITAKAAARFASIAVALRQQYDERRVAHFINKLVFCLFAEDIDLLPGRVFAVILDEAVKESAMFETALRNLFRAMANPHGLFGAVTIPWFNGGLFDDDDVLPLGQNQLRDLTIAARLDWKAIDPTIFGTLFESGLDDKKRAEMASLFDAPEPEDHAQASLFMAPAANRGVGIHYTDEATIMKIIEPVVVAPLRREWERIKAEIREADERRARARAPAEKERLLAKARGLYADFRASLGRYRVLDPACGSGNFLALSLRVLKDFDLSVTDDAAAMGLPPDDFRVGPEAVLGIEINPYAAELARLTVWITELQWQLRKGLAFTRRPILDKLDGIVRADALITQSGNEREWPEADVVVGNPPFLGGKRMRNSLGDVYVKRLFAVFAGRVPAEADLVAYWFAKASDRMRQGRVKRAGLVATQAIRRGASRSVLDRIAQEATIYDAWADEPWVVRGAAVRVSLICFGINAPTVSRLDGHAVPEIHSDLSGEGIDLTSATHLEENSSVCFQGPVKVGSFDVSGAQARKWLLMPVNPNGRGNADVLRPWVNGRDLTARRSDTWIIDFGGMSEAEAALYQAPFEYVRLHIRPFREKNADRQRREKWWRLGRSGADLREAELGLSRVVATPRVAKHRFFVWIAVQVLPDSRVNAVARDDDVTFGVLQSGFHEAWSLRLGGWHGVGNDPQYTPRMGFETFPFPEGLTPNIPAAAYADDQRAIAIAEAARRLDALREAWLNPPDLVRRVPEVVAGYPDRVLPVDPSAAAILKTRTLTNLYNERPAWLDNAHRDLDAAVAAAYGWPADISEEDALSRLLALNLERAAAGR